MCSAQRARAGRYVAQPAGYRAFIPTDLPPKPPIVYDGPMLDALSRADRALGRLDGASETLPNPDLFVAMYVRKEAVLSSQIEGTQASLMDVLEFEAEEQEADGPPDVAEVVNYVRAMNHGLERLRTIPVSLRLIREIHEKLLSGVRGSERMPGRFRRSQNWIGPPGTSLKKAQFVPPPPHEMKLALGNLEVFLHDDMLIPLLVKLGLVHAQFETIHPFLDGNGRVGRLLITFLLCEKEALRRPLLYISLFFKAHRQEYYEKLQAVRDRGDWEDWLRFFLRGVCEVAEEATTTARSIVSLREECRKMITTRLGRRAGNGHRLLEQLFYRPIVSATTASRIIGATFATGSILVKDFTELGILRETTGRSRDRRFVFDQYLKLFGER